MAPPGVVSSLVLLIAICHCTLTWAHKDDQNALAQEDLQCKDENLKLCKDCLAQLGLALKTCCKDSDAMSRCQHDMRKKRDVSGDLQSSESEALYQALTNPQVVSRSRPFLGKRAPRYMLGKRDDNAPLIDYLVQQENRKRAGSLYRKKARPFLGKRSDEYDEEDFVDEFDEKRARPFLGKRTRPFLGKRARPFLGKRDYNNDEIMNDLEEAEKRARPFLGKRGGSRPFLGKRDDDGEMADAMEELEKRRRYMLGKRDYDNADFEKRRRYMLGKRSIDDVSEEESN